MIIWDTTFKNKFLIHSFLFKKAEIILLKSGNIFRLVVVKEIADH